MTIAALGDALETVERERKRLDVYTSNDYAATELETQFATKNVTVDHRRTAATDDGFVAVRDADGAFQGALGLGLFESVLSPEIHPPWTLEATDGETEAKTLFDFLENTLFASYDRRQMLAASREIEERAWRVADGTLYAGFQREDALVEQLGVYERLAAQESLSVVVFIEDQWTEPAGDLTVVSDNGELGRFWFVAFDGAGSDHQKCALVATERQPGRYYGFWTYTPEFVDDLIGHLEGTYLH
jgi:hypothetical protein